MKKADFHGLSPAQLKEILGGSSLDELIGGCSQSCRPGCSDSCKGGTRGSNPVLQPVCPGSVQAIPVLCATATLKVPAVPVIPVELAE